MNNDGWLLGIDGGGTKTEAWIANRQTLSYQRAAAKGTTGPSNPRAVGVDEAKQQIQAAIEQALADLDKSVSFEAACIAIAGADRSDIRSQLTEWALRSGFANKLIVCNDAEPILASNASGLGVALISGTGSFAYGKHASGEVCRVGGWGFRFGDEGSGYAIGASGIRAALQAADGRAEGTCLLEKLLDRFQVAKERDLIEHLYAPDFGRRQIAEFAVLVLEAAEQDDSAAVKIRQNAASDLAALVRAVSKDLKLLPDSLPLAIAGSLLIHSQTLLDEMLADLLASGFHVQLTKVPNPVCGALKLAAAL